jgi:hypothetical protein
MENRKDWVNRYNGADRDAVDGFPWARWPDILIKRVNLERLIEGIMTERVDWPDLIFEGQPPPDEVLEAIEIMVAVPDLQVRLAPEGCYLKSRMVIHLRLGDPDDKKHSFDEQLDIESELCLSFTERYGVCPVIDIMSGLVVLKSTGTAMELESGTEVIDLEQAVDWGLNGNEPDEAR